MTEPGRSAAPQPPPEDHPTCPGRPSEVDGPAVYRFVGGPLDGRVQTRPPAEPVPATIRHAHLHDGPQIVHLYDLHAADGRGGEYRVRAG